MAIRRNNRGALLLIGLFAISCLAVLVAAGLTRSLTELNSASLDVSNYRAFHLAESGLDEAIVRLSDPDLVINTLLSIPQDERRQVCAIPGCSYTIEDNEASASENGDPTTDVDGMVSVHVDGQSGNVSEGIIATVQLPATILDHGFIGCTLNLRDTVRLGEAFSWFPSVRVNYYVRTDRRLTNDVWSNALMFMQGSASCYPRCNDGSVFHGPPRLLTRVGIPSHAYTTLDITPYWKVAQGQSGTDCLGRDYHHIVSDTVINGNDCSDGEQDLDGIIYVEKGVNLDLAGNVTIRGTIVHEGYDAEAATRDERAHVPGYDEDNYGRIRLNPGANIVIDSYSGANTFAPGVAILGGAPLLSSDSSTSVDINGFIMVGGGGARHHYHPGTDIRASGTINGGIVSTGSFQYMFASGEDGPVLENGIDNSWDWSKRWVRRWDGTWVERGSWNDSSFHGAVLRGDLRIIYKRPPRVPPGFGFQKARILSWRFD